MVPISLAAYLRVGYQTLPSSMETEDVHLCSQAPQLCAG